MKVHFICNGNIFRSIIAEAYLQSLGIAGMQVISSGTMADAHREANRSHQPSVISLLNKHGLLPFYKSEPDQLTQARTDNQDITICLNAIAYANAQRIVTLPPDTIIWNITDIGEADRIAVNGDRSELSELVFNEVKQQVDALIRDSILDS
ncbi:MAG TPA: hypothetical protein VGE30_00145 [Candidatus Saccharimonadales bacterium]